jgi:ubiquinone/menaquinone biosynthesis C-methylase UbiE
MSNLNWDTLYTDHVDAYETLVRHEDYQGNLIRAIDSIQPLSGSMGVEFGCGTGRVSGLLAGPVQQMVACDFTNAMIRATQANKRRSSWDRVALALADSRKMPIRSGWADFAIEGWAFLQIAVLNPDNWQIHLRHALEEMERVVRRGGRLILIETLGTGETIPKVPNLFREVYDTLEKGYQFTSLNLRTDYCFETKDQIQEIIVPLFGEEMLDRTTKRDDGWILPECTGIWWKET